MPLQKYNSEHSTILFTHLCHLSLCLVVHIW